MINSKLKFNEEIKKIKIIDINKEIDKYQLLVDDLLNDYKLDLINKDELENYNRVYLGKINKLRIELEELEKSKMNSFNEDWIKKFKEKKELDVIDRNIIIEFIDNIYDKIRGLSKIEKHLSEKNSLKNKIINNIILIKITCSNFSQQYL